MEKEIWKSVPNYEGIYEASSYGRIRSLDREVPVKGRGYRKIKGRVLKTENKVNGAGYEGVCLCDEVKCSDFMVHQVIASAFLTQTSKGYERVVNHIDGDRLNNRLDNLEVVSQRDNVVDGFRRKGVKRTSNYIGVSYNKKNNKWKASIGFKGGYIHLGHYKCEIDASNAYKNALGKIEYGTFNPIDYKWEYSCELKGVHLGKKNSVNRYIACVGHMGKSYTIGYFPTELLAHEAYLKAKSEIANGTFLSNREKKKQTT